MAGDIEGPNGDPRATVRRFLASTFYIAPGEPLADDASLLDAGIIDSTGVLEIIAFLEKTFRVKVDDAEIVPENLDSVDSIVRYVERKRTAAGTGAAQ